MTQPRQPYQFSYTEDDEPLPVWQQMAARARPVDPTALPPGLARDVISNPEDEAQRAARIADEAGRAARAADPTARIALASGGSVGRGVMAPPSDPGESIASMALSGGQDVLPGIAESGAELVGASPETAADIANSVRTGATDVLSRGYLALPQGVRSAVSSEYSPESLASEFVPFSDELAGTVETVRRGTPWRENMDAASRRRDEMAREYPNSALVGQVAQGIVSAPLFPAPVAATEGVPSVLRAAVGSGARGMREGALIGAVAGADRSENRPIVSMYDVARGARPVGDLGTNLLGFAEDVGGSTAMGGAMGGALSAVAGGAGARYQQLRAIGEHGSLDDAAAARLRAYDDAVASQPSADTEFLPGIAGNESIPESSIESLTAPPGIQAGDDLANYRTAASAIQDRPVSLRSLPDEAFRNDPNLLRTNAVGLADTRQTRGVARSMGVNRFSEALDRYGVMPRGDISATETYRGRGEALRNAAGQRMGQLEDAWDNAVASGQAQPIDAQEVGARLRVLGDEYARAGDVQNAREVYQVAQDMVETTPVMQDGQLVARETRPTLTISQIRDELIPQIRERTQTYYEGTPRGPRSLEAMQSVYRLLNDVRDEAMESGLGAQGVRDYRMARDAYQVGSLVSPSGEAALSSHRPVTLRGSLGMMTGASLGSSLGGQVGGAPGALLGAGAGALIGNAAGRRWVQFEPAVMAAMADPAAGSVAARARGVLGNVAGQLTSPVAPVASTATPGIVARLALSAPESLGRYGGILSDAARRGTVDAVLAGIQRHDPEAATEIEDAVNDVDPAHSEAATREWLQNQLAPQQPDDEANAATRAWLDEQLRQTAPAR